YAGIAKCNDDLLFNWQCRYCQSLGSGNRVHKVLSNSNLQTKGVIVVNEGRKEIIISFRGTETEINLIQDINIVLNDFLDFDNNLFKVRNLKVHNGFLTMTNSLFESMVQSLQELLRQDQGYTLIFTGHSLGGAIAGLSAVKAYYKLNLPKERIKVFTFGQPRLGNKEYASYVNQLGLTYYRMVNYNDPVPHAPPRLFGYFHHSLELF
ncbi:alpha/beta-hydrolase, partial [Neoconidiobolus thromboides FSU 785]